MTDTLRIHDRARALVAEHLCRDVDQVTPDAHFMDDLGGDSLDRIELCMAVEDEFRVEMSDDEADKIFNDGTFGDLTAWLERQRVEA